MTRIGLRSERVGAAGGFQGGGMVKLLGAPRMDDLTILAREAVQNSWDARLPSDPAETVDFHIRLFHLDGTQRAALEALLVDPPEQGSPLRPVLAEKKILVAEVRDEGAKGLNGPTRADRASGTDRNFVNFIRNIGAQQSRDRSGGTYGFGKGSYYRVSRARTIIAHTRCSVDGKIRSRLIAAAVGDPFEDGGRQFTGRHFWGIPEGTTDLAEPLLDTEADDIAKAIGFGVPSNTTGTAILIVGFDTGTTIDPDDAEIAAQVRTPMEAGTHIAHQLAWQCWPKLVERDGSIPMAFHVEVDGTVIPVPGSDGDGRVPALKSFIATLRDLHAQRKNVKEAWCGSPKVLLGHLATRTFQAEDPSLGFGSESLSGFEVPTHHVALLRAPELVVKYLEGPEPDLDDVGWTGVFIAHPDVDVSFAESEPPTHDDWKPGQPDDPRTQTHVRVALRRIREHLKDEFVPKPAPVMSENVPVAKLAATLGRAFMTPGTNASRPTADEPAAKAAPGKKRSPKVKQLGSRFDMVDGHPAILIRLDTTGSEPTDVFEASAAVAIDAGSAERDAPAGARTPEVLGWLADGELVVHGNRLDPVPAGDRLEVAIRHLHGISPTVTVERKGSDT